MTMTIKLSNVVQTKDRGGTPPGMLQSASRGGAVETDPLLAGVVVEQTYELAPRARGDAAGKAKGLEADERLLALETEDGGILFIRADTLAEQVALRRPEAVRDGEVDLAAFRDPNATARGVGDLFWKSVSVLKLPQDGLADEARDLALKWARERQGDAVTDKAAEATSTYGAKALMQVIESRLAGRPGLYRWHERRLAASDRCPERDPRLAEAAGKPMLVLVHGTASYTLGSYADLREDRDTWDRLCRRFPGGIFGFEHRTFSESPAENALALLEALPEGAQVSLVSHSRGGLVADLLCLGRVDDAAIDAYRIDTHGAEDPEGLEREAAEERARLRRIVELLDTKRITVERYVRVACPARGTRILSDNLDVALSDLLGLMQSLGGALLGATAAALGGPVAGEGVGKAASSCLGVVKRLALEIAGRRIDPQLVPGIAAMRVDSPLAAFLAHPGTRRRDGIDMAVIAGDTEFEGLGFGHPGRRIANLFCDWRLFDRNDNDLVVDTDSMFQGLGRQAGARYLYDQGDAVSHFRYFLNPLTRDSLREWLTVDRPAELDRFRPLDGGARLPWRDRPVRQARGGEADRRPVVILIPGIMGSHIEVIGKQGDEPGSGNRIWFDPVSLCAGGLGRIADPAAPDVQAEDIFEMFYGDLADHLAGDHEVVRFAYDWRKPVPAAAAALAGRIAELAGEFPDRPIHLLAHSLGGLVARTLLRKHAEAWRQVLDSGGRLVLLGTPNNGSHLLAHTLLGKSDAMRMLEKIDAVHGLQAILDIVAGFPGALSLLPRPGFDDGGGPGCVASQEYYAATTWQELKDRNTDRWYGDRIAGLPTDDGLAVARAFWNETLPGNDIDSPDRVAYVFGQADKTPCGIERTPDGRLRLVFTREGDGSVTWASGRLGGLPENNCWYMPVEHADLTGTDEYFPAIVDLLAKGGTEKLGRLPQRRGALAPDNFVLDAAPPVLPDAEELARACLGSGPRRARSGRGRATLRVSVQAGDLRFIDRPVLCGHYIGDPISGAEAVLDDMLRGALAERERLGLYAGGIGTSAIVLQPPSGPASRGSLPGAVVVGLGKFDGRLGARQVTETVRGGVMRLLLHLRDTLGTCGETEVKLYSLLIGWGSTASISVAESLAAVTLGVLEANREFGDALGKGDGAVRITDLCFVELYRDAAISAAQAVRELPDYLKAELARIRARIEPARALEVGEGVAERLSASGDGSHWARLIVTDADAQDGECPPECHEPRRRSPVPADAGADGADGEPATGRAEARGSDATPAGQRYYPGRLKYLLLSARARAESVVQQRQPGLVEAIVAAQRGNPRYDPALGHILFQLMVPLDFKAAAREQARLVLVLDRHTAGLPWELLQADGGPLVLRMPMVRQLATLHYRPVVRTANANTACVIVAPSTEGYDKRFRHGGSALPDLPAAEKEGQAIRASLISGGWDGTAIRADPPGREALDVLAGLYARPYRVLAISGHGVFEAQALDGRSYTGVVLSDGLLLTAVEIGQMEVVPEVVFLNCCHLGSIGNTQPNRMAYSLASELVEMGVRCVVAAGWAVDDEAACTFAGTFFEHLCHGDSFGDALFEARKAAWQRHPACNTWGAYQAYGDPAYRLDTGPNNGRERMQRPHVAVAELLASLERRRLDGQRLRKAGKAPGHAQQQRWLERELARCPSDWTDRPEVAEALGGFWGEHLPEGYEAARAAYMRAIRAGAVSAVEHLASLAARRAWYLAGQGEAGDAMPLVDDAIERLDALCRATAMQAGGAASPERVAKLGSAWKLKAAVRATLQRPWPEVAESLEQAAAAYARGSDPRNGLNALALGWLAGQAADPELALRYGSPDRDAGDAELVAWLLGRTLSKPADTLAEAYAEAATPPPPPALAWEPPAWRWLALFLRRRRGTGDARRVKVLEELAARLEQG